MSSHGAHRGVSSKVSLHSSYHAGRTPWMIEPFAPFAPFEPNPLSTRTRIQDRDDPCYHVVRPPATVPHLHLLPETLMLTLSQVQFRYPHSDFSLRVARLHVAAGECVALTGPSGSGKTTLLHLAAGLLVPSAGGVSRAANADAPLEAPGARGAGRVIVDNVELSAQSEAARRRFRLTRLGLVFQSFELLPHLSARDNIELPSRLAGLLSSYEERLAPLAETLGITALLDRYPTRLSHGECQRIAIARAMLHGPAMLLADEPTGNLDPGKKQAVVELLLEACRDRGAAVLMATHDMELLAMFDRNIRVSEFAAAPGVAS